MMYPCQAVKDLVNLIPAICNNPDNSEEAFDEIWERLVGSFVKETGKMVSDPWASIEYPHNFVIQCTGRNGGEFKTWVAEQLKPFGMPVEGITLSFLKRATDKGE